MSSSAATASPQSYRQTFWCYECDMSVSLFSSSSSSSSHPLCPHCHGDFIEHMEAFPSTPPPQNHNPNPNTGPPLLSSLIDPFLPSSPLPLPLSDSDDSDSDLSAPTLRISEDFLSSPYLDRLVHHLAADPDSASRRSSSSPASKASVESIPTIKITAAILAASDPLLCAVCKDEFVLDVEAKQLPCNHIYHSDCILPWLSQHNSCPVCRFRLPTDDQDRPSRVGNLMDGDQDDLYAMERTLRHIARRHRLVFPARSSPTQLAQAEGSLSVGPANSGETVSSFPMESGSDGVPPTVSGGAGAGAERAVNDEGGSVMSEVRAYLMD